MENKNQNYFNVKIKVTNTNRFQKKCFLKEKNKMIKVNYFKQFHRKQLQYNM